MRPSSTRASSPVASTRAGAPEKRTSATRRVPSRVSRGVTEASAASTAYRPESATTTNRSTDAPSGTSTFEPLSRPSAKEVSTGSSRPCGRPASAHASVALSEPEAIPLAAEASRAGAANARVEKNGAGNGRYPVSSNSTAWSRKVSSASSQPIEARLGDTEGSPPEPAKEASDASSYRDARNERAKPRSSDCSSENAKSMSTSLRQAEDALGDDVAQDLRRPRLDRVAARPQLPVLPEPVPRRLRAGDLRVQAEHRLGQRGQPLVRLAPGQLHPRTLRARDAGLQQCRQRPVVGEAQRLHLDPLACDGVADHRIVGGPATVGPRLLDQLDQLVDHALQLGRQREPERAALVQQGRHRHLPPVARLTQDRRARHAYVVEEDLVELRVAGDLVQRPYGDSRRVHVGDEVGQPSVL